MYVFSIQFEPVQNRTNKRRKTVKHLGTFFGAMTAGILVFAVWGSLAEQYGWMGGWLAGMVTISLGWGVNHFTGVLVNEEGATWTDMALGIAIAGMTMGMFNGQSIVNSFPTIFFLGLGGALGGLVAGIVTKASQGQGE